LGIKIIDVALSQLDTRRANIGALTNRLNSTVSALSSAAENATSANSRIQDADFAQETANMSRNQILQQAGVAILAQANASPQSALKLLQG
jgi:flagellin